MIGEGKALLSVHDVALTLSISTTTVKRLAYAGKIESVTIGDRRLFPADAVGAYVAKLRAQE